MKMAMITRIALAVLVVLGLSGSVWAATGEVIGYQKISDTEGNFYGILNDNDRMSNSMASLGDLDGDGVIDLVVGAREDNDGGAHRGAVWVLFLNSDGTVKSHQKISDTEGNFTGVLDNSDEFGSWVAGIGDLDSDGAVDAAVGAVWDDDGGSDRGAVWILFLNSDGTVKGHQKISDTEGGFTGTLSNAAGFGQVTKLGDMDNDGVMDIAVGAAGPADGGRGAVWILFLNTDGTVKGNQKISDTEGGFTGTLDDNDRFGIGITALGDIDSDNVTDIAVGALFDDDGGSDTGAVWILFLNSNGTVKGHQKISDTEGNFLGILDDYDQFGVSVACPGDLDGDGVNDLFVGANVDDDGGGDRGAVWILFLNSDGMVKSHQKISSTEGNFTGTLDDYDGFGQSVVSLGDLNKDGCVDLAAGAPADDDGGADRGAVWIMFLDIAMSYASNPSPADGAVIPGEIYVDNIWTKLIFVPGATAVEHTGYFSDNYDDVAGRVEDANLGPPPYGHLQGWEYTFMVGNPQVGPAVDSLVRGTRYYWCVDETDAQGTTFPGNIWEFTVRDYKACCPNPPDGAVVSGPDVLLSWVPGFGAEEYDVYFGTDFNDVNDGYSGPGDPYPLAEYLGTVTEPNILVTGLAENTWYYWRVDGVAGRVPPFYIPTEFYKGDVWSFKTKKAGPVAHWKFDEGTGSIAYDSAGNNDGAIYGAVWASGVIDVALDFDGVDDYVNLGNDNSLKPPLPVTLCAWINLSNLGKHQIIVRLDERSTQYYYGIWLYIADYDKLNVGYGDGGPADMWHRRSKTGVTELSQDSWCHVAAVINGPTDITLYVNGVDDGGNYSGSGGSLTYSTGNSYIAGENIYPFFFDGLMDDVRIYDRALSAVEVEELYNSVPVPPVGETYHVDGVSGDNTNDGLTPETAFKTIQRGINVAEDFDTVLVWPGVYNEEISFWGDAITVKSAADAAIVETDYGYAFSFFSAEEPNTVLSNFVIRNSQYGIYLINGSSPTLRNLTIVNNDFGISAFNGADPDISSCIFWNNYFGDLFRDPVPLEAKYSWLQDEVNEPIAYWRFDEGTGSVAYDSAGTNDGTLVNGPVWTTGKIGGALDFDGVDDYIEVPDDTTLDLDQEATLSAWVNTRSLSVSQGIVGRWNYAGSPDKESIMLWTRGDYDNTFMFGISTDGTDATMTLLFSNLQYSQNTWYYITGTYDRTTMRLYVNGESDNYVSKSGNIFISDTNWYIGTLNYASVSYFNGLIDDVRIYDRALSVGEIEAIYEAGLAGLSYGGPGFVDAAGGDYHLKSERGRYWPEHDVWVLDDVTSPCIDGGDPTIGPSNERMPNGGRINMGAYGNTAYASMSEWPIKGDTNKDGRFNFMDIAILLDEWLAELAWAE